MFKKILCVLLFLFPALFLSTSAAISSSDPQQEIDFGALDAWITGQMGQHGIPGIALAVTRGEEILYMKGYGTAGQGRPMTPQTPLYIGSQSKSFTALAIAQLVEQGKVDVALPVQSYIPWFRVADEQASRTITLSHLLHHNSGLSESGFSKVLPDEATIEDVVRALAEAKLTQPVGATMQYFNYGYDVLALVVEQVSGQSYADYVQTHIFDPLQMRNSYTDPVLARSDGLSQGYSRLFGFTIPRQQPHRVYELGAGYLMSSAEDLAHYAIAMNNDAVYQGAALLQPDGIQTLFYPVYGYGWGWFIAPDHIFHGGANETFKTFVNLYPSKDIGIVLLLNQGYMFDSYFSSDQIFGGVEDIVLGRNNTPQFKGLSPRWMGHIMGLFVLGLTIFQVRNLLGLRHWRVRASRWTRRRKEEDILINFLIPSVMIAIIVWQVKGFFGYRVNLTYQLLILLRFTPDIAFLCLIGTLPDYIAGLTKLAWVLAGKVKPSA